MYNRRSESQLEWENCEVRDVPNWPHWQRKKTEEVCLQCSHSGSFDLTRKSIPDNVLGRTNESEGKKKRMKERKKEKKKKRQISKERKKEFFANAFEVVSQLAYKYCT